MTDDGVADTAALDAQPVIGAGANGGRVVALGGDVDREPQRR